MKNNNYNYNNKINLRYNFHTHQLKRSFRLLLFALFVTLIFTKRTGYGMNSAAAAELQKNQSVENLVQSDHYQYGIGSVSKMFATVAVMKLVDEGKIGLDTPIIYYIPEFCMADKRYRQITPKMLLNHSSGIMGTTGHNSFLSGHSDTSYHDTFLDQLRTQELKADPGEYSVYCNDGFMLAEILVERVSGMSFSEFIRKEISEPLGLTNTSTPMEDLDESLLAPIYYDNHTLPYVNCQLLASGGLYSTSEDLCKFAQIFMKNSDTNLLSAKAVDTMSRPWYLEDKICVSKGDTQFGYGLGWDCVNTYPYNLYGIQALTKGGDVNGYHAGLTVLPKQNLSIAITTSGGSSSYCQEAAQDIILEVLKEEGLISEIKDIKIKVKNKIDAAPLPEEMKKYEGTYLSKNMLKVEFNDEGTLLLTPLDSEYDIVQKYVYTGSGEFESTNGYYMDSTGNFISNANGNKGRTKFSFRKESNGKVYMIGTTYESTNGLGEFAATLPIAEKVEPHHLNNAVFKKWEDRTNKNYYLVNEVYHSQAFLDDPIINFKPLDNISGYVTKYNNYNSNEICRIIDANNAKNDVDLPLLLGRDLCCDKFFHKNKAEYVSVGSYRYVGEEAVKSSKELTSDNVIMKDDLSSWYYITKEDAGAIIEILVPNHGAYYVYDKDDHCIASSLFKNEANSVMLPTDGKIVFTGAKGSIFHIKKE